ncbi:DNA repair protein [Schistosoma japonicum]|uniref:DNA repair protein n=1 Tax=Schistosoma japonicum TaxID=6182 RepID=A0A4Z2DJ98_SCHJA|nr:DNA repair protein [Schistosoma japonicum]TNN16585.1 DNA repair protein [Schistosoma japonicum]
MGVPGLWRLLEPAKEPIELQQLSGKIVAIDMNIWLHQAVKSRGSTNGPRNYLAIFFRRLCKLLFYGIKPVFVFDGDTPALKRSTMNLRRQSRRLIESKAEKAQKHLLRRLLRRVAESSVKSSSILPSKKTESFDIPAKHELLRRLRQRFDSHQAKEDAEMFSAPSNNSKSSCDNNNNILLSEKAGVEYDELARDFLDTFRSSGQNFSDVDLNSDAFCSLPLPAQLRVVQLMRETLDSGSCRNELVQVNDEAKFDPEKFSDVQMKRLLLRRRLAERQQELSDNLTKQEAIEQVLQLNNSVIKNILQNQSFFSTLPFCNSKQPTIESIETVATAMRIQSQDVGHAILIKQSPVKHISGITKLPSSTTLDLDKLITYNAQNLNVSEKHDEAETSKDGQKEVINCDATGGNLCLVQETNMLVNKNIVYNFDCASIESPIVKEYSNETDKKIQYNDDCKNSNKSVMDKSLVELSSEILPQSLSDSDINKSLDYIEPFTLEHPDDLIEVKQNEITTKSGTSSDVHETEYFQVHEDDRHSEIKSSTGEDDDDFIDVDTDEHAEISSVSSDSNTLQNHSTDRFQNENEFNSVYSEKEFVSNEVVCYANRKEDILSSESYDDDYTEDDSVLRENADRLTRQAQSTTTRCISEAQDLLRLFGFPFIVSPEEAEAQCVALQRHNLVDIVASDDSDVWPFGVKIVCRHLFGTGSDRKMKNNPSVYKLDEVRRKLGLTMANILRLTLLCGSDYTHGINQVGPVTAIEILSEFAESDDSLDSEINNWLHGVDKPSEELLQSTLKPLVEFAHWWQTTHTQNSSQSMNMPRIPEPNPVRRRWMNLKPYPGFPDSRIARAYLYPNVNINLPPFKWGSPCVTLLVKHVNTVLGWSTEKTESILSSVLKHRHSVELGNPVTSMPLLTNFFPTVNKVCEKSAVSGHYVSSELDEVIVPSKRVRQAANRLRNQKTNNKTPKSATSSKDQDSLLSELPKPPRKCRGRETVKKSTNGAKALLKKRKEKPRIKPERRIVERVCLSEEDED